MFCNKCGQQIPDASKFCPICGNMVTENNQENQEYPAVQTPLQTKKKFPFVWLIVGVLVLVIAVVGIVFAVRGKGEKSKWEKQLDLGNKYLSELNYEQAIAAFEKVIEIDPNNIEAYMGLAEAYAAMGDYDAAIAALEKGIKRTDAQELADYLELIEMDPARETDLAGIVPTPTPVITLEATPTPISTVELEPTVTPILTAEPEPTETPAPTTEPEPTEIPIPTQQASKPGFIPWSEAGLEDHVMDWKDANLEAVMRKIVTGITDRDIMLSDVWEITILGLAFNNISDISALGNLMNLTFLDLSWNNISDISVLGNLTNLETLSLRGNPITDYTPVSFVRNLDK